jgi:hypothetical protein
MRLLIIISVWIVSSLSAFAQDTIITMSGLEIPCKIIDKEDFELRYEFTKKNGKLKERGLHKSEIFALVIDGNEEVIYAPDPILGDDFSVQEMRIFIAGEQDARKYFSTMATFWVGAGTAGLAAILAQGAFLATLAVPILYPIVQLLPYIKIKEKYISDPNHRYNEIYASGFESVARGKKVVAGLKGAAIGAVIGAIVIAIISPDQP